MATAPIDFTAPLPGYPAATNEQLQRGEAQAARLQIVTAAEMGEPLPPVPWLCRKLGIAPGAPTLVAGYGFVGKSLVAQSLAVAVASGKELWGTFSVRGGRVLHVDYEQGRRITSERYQRLAHGAGLNLAELSNLEASILPTVHLDTDGALDLLCRMGDGRALVIVDSFRAGCPSTDENSSEVRPVLDRMTLASEKTGCTFLLIHHARKPRGDDVGGAKMSIRGSSGFFDGSQCVLLLSAQKGEPIIVEHEKDRIEGMPCEAFGLRIVDTDDRQGLALEFMPPEQVDEPARTRSARAAEEREQRRLRTKERTEAERAEGDAKRAHKAELERQRVDAFVRECMAEGITGRELKVEVKARAHVGTKTAEVAIARCRPRPCPPVP